MGYETIGTVKGHNRRMSIKPQPPGPKGQLLLGSLRDFQRDQLAFYSSCARVFLRARPRDVVATRFGPSARC
jgi:hypothetical protein